MKTKSAVLVVDDDPAFRTLARSLLEDMDFEVMEAEDVASGLAMAVKDPPQLIILDMVMPVKSGQDFLVAARSTGAIRHVPILVCSGRASEMDARRCRILGADGYIAKPLDMEEFDLKVRKATGR